MPSPTGAIQEGRVDLAQQAAVVIITYDSSQYITDCLQSVLASDPGEVVVVDSGSTDGTIETVESEFPDVQLIQTETNMGYGGASNRGVQAVESKYVVVMNPDTRVAPDMMEELLTPLDENDQLITIPRILTYDGEMINTIGNVVHFTGLALTRGFGDPPDAYTEPMTLAGISGACFATNRATYEEMGGFEEAIFMYMDDTELSWKANSMDIEIHYIPTAVVYHDYPGLDIDPMKLFHLERGRYIILRKYLDPSAVALLLPSLLFSELITWAYAVLQGPAGVRAKVRAVVDGLSTEVESVDIDNREFLARLDERIPANQLRSSVAVTTAIRVINKLYETNMSLVNR